MREENTNLRAQLRRFDSDAEAARGEAESRVRSDLEALARELRVVQRERDLLRWVPRRARRPCAAWHGRRYSTRPAGVGRRDRCETAEAALEEASHRLKRTDASKRKAVERATEDVTSMREALREARARARSLQAEVDALLKPRTSSAPRSRASPSGRPGRAPPSAARPAGPASSSRPGSVPLRSREPRDPPRREPPHRTSARSSSSNPRSALSPLALERIQNRSRPWANATPSVGSRSRDSTPTRVRPRRRCPPGAALSFPANHAHFSELCVCAESAVRPHCVGAAAEGEGGRVSTARAADVYAPELASRLTRAVAVRHAAAGCQRRARAPRRCACPARIAGPLAHRAPPGSCAWCQDIGAVGVGVPQPGRAGAQGPAVQLHPRGCGGRGRASGPWRWG